MSGEGAFARAFRAEMNAAAHDALVNLYTSSNRQGYGSDPELQQRGEEWARQIEAAGTTWAVLEATAEKPCPECGR